ncbi:MAG: biotin transporter BioY [Clostridia bacterium]|nr:biotin transporter BioY [Clostridia bacterium]
MVFSALFAALIALCAWVQVPFQIPFTMQTFAVFSALLFLGGKYGTLSILVYTLLGAAGLPVFTGFRGGFGALFGVTGGYITGFLLGALFYWALGALLEKKGRQTFAAKTLSLVGVLMLCYAFGTLWFTAVQGSLFSPAAFFSALGVCVAPFAVPDLCKLILALFLYRKLAKYVPEIEKHP